MAFIYDIIISLYGFAMKIAGTFNTKARQRVSSLKTQNVKNISATKQKRILMHCASLGEYEQGQPLLKKIKETHPEIITILTFFSPSGYEKRKNTPEADYVYYLPNDTKKQATEFINAIKPDLAIYVKYEFWFRHLEAVKKQGGKNILLAGLFRENQYFFRPVRHLMPNVLSQFKMFLLQNKKSIEILKKAGFENAEFTGDPRFDRVFAIARENKKFDFIEKFKGNSMLIVAGSTWAEDESLFARYMKENQDVKLVLAPHEIHEEHISQIKKEFDNQVMLYSQKDLANADKTRCLVIDNIGILSHLYKYADVCYVGGGFKAGIHNTLEAAVYGKPVVFGHKYKKFSEACELVEQKAGFPISNYTQFADVFNGLLGNPTQREEAGKTAKQYCETMRGSTDKSYQRIMAEVG